MYFTGKLIIDDIAVNILRYNISFDQKASENGKPSQRPLFLGLSLTIEVNKKLDLGTWAVADYLAKQIEIQLKPVVEGGRSRRIKLFDAHLVTWKTNFSAVDNRPMSETLFITAAGVEDTHSAGVYSAKWRKTFSGEAVEPATLDNSPELIRYYITDLEGNEIDEYDISDKIILNIETKNAIGENLTVKIPDKTYDFKYKGTVLQNDTLNDYQINNNLEKVELEVIEQQN